MEHEPNGLISARLTCCRFKPGQKYGEVNSYLLTSARYIGADYKAVLLRDPYQICRSIVRTGNRTVEGTILYVREGISILDNLARDGFQVIRFRGITTDRNYLIRCARRLGIENLTRRMIDLSPINHHVGKERRIIYGTEDRREFDEFKDLYGL